LSSPPLAVIDLEATCIDKPSCRVLAAALIPLNDLTLDLNSARCAFESTRERVGSTALIHGITSGFEGIAGCDSSLDGLIRDALDYTLIVYGYHDVRLLAGEATRRGLSGDRSICYIDVLDTLLRNPARREKARVEGGGRYTLEDAVAELLGTEMPSREFHDPLVDAFYTGLVYIALVKRGEKLRARCVKIRSTRGVLARLMSIFRS